MFLHYTRHLTCTLYVCACVWVSHSVSGRYPWESSLFARIMTFPGSFPVSCFHRSLCTSTLSFTLQLLCRRVCYTYQWSSRRTSAMMLVSDHCVGNGFKTQAVRTSRVQGSLVLQSWSLEASAIIKVLKWILLRKQKYFLVHLNFSSLSDDHAKQLDSAVSLEELKEARGFQKER